MAQFITLVFLVLSTQWVFAIGCGDMVTSDIVFEDDLHCDTGYFALEVLADNVTVDMNGYTLSGTEDLMGIVISGYRGVTVKNGNFEGFWSGINAADSDDLVIENNNFYGVSSGVTVSSGNRANIIANNFLWIDGTGVSVLNRVAGQSANNALISHNQFYLNGVGISVCGAGTDFAKVKHNFIWKSQDWGLILQRARNPQVYDNTILQAGLSALRLDGVKYALVSNNSFRNGLVGVSLFADASSACLDDGDSLSYKNKMTGNHIFGYETGLVLGLGLTTGQVLKNVISHNKIYNNITGAFLNTDAHENNVTNNAYGGTDVHYVDLGVDNQF